MVCENQAHQRRAVSGGSGSPRTTRTKRRRDGQPPESPTVPARGGGRRRGLGRGGSGAGRSGARLGRASDRAGRGAGACTALTPAQADVARRADLPHPAVGRWPAGRARGRRRLLHRRALATFNAGTEDAVRRRRADLDRRAAAQVAGRGRLRRADAGAAGRAAARDREDAVLPGRALRHASSARSRCRRWGGNRDYAGWHMLGFEHQPLFQAPFGYYDADVNRKG